MHDSSSPKHTLLPLIRNQLMPWACEETTPCVLIQPPFHGADTSMVTPQKTSLLPDKTRPNSARAVYWPDIAMNALLTTSLCVVLEGPIEMRVGVTQRQAKARGLSLQHGHYLLRLPERAFGIIPAGVPYDDGTRSHWHSTPEVIPDSHILWIQNWPQGIAMHRCHTRQGIHRTEETVSLFDMHLPLLLDLMSDALQNSGASTQKGLRYYLLALFSRMEQAIEVGNARVLSAMPEGSPVSGVQLHHGSQHSAQALLVQRACRFIEANHTKPLTVQSIADQLYISPSHLNRLFRNELEMAPMKYVAQHRMEVARSLLEETNYSIFDISKTIGYSHPDVFRRAFRNHFGVGPVAFRSRHRHKLRSSSTLRKSD